MYTEDNVKFCATLYIHIIHTVVLAEIIADKQKKKKFKRKSRKNKRRKGKKTYVKLEKEYKTIEIKEKLKTMESKKILKIMAKNSAFRV